MDPLNRRQILALPEGSHTIADNLQMIHEDRDGLAARSLFFRWQQDGRRRKLALGKWSRERYAEVLAEAARYRETLAEGRDPSHVASRLVAAGTFAEAARQFQGNAAWTNAKHRAQWATTMEQVDKVLGHLPVAEVRPEHVARALGPRWLEVPVSARRELRRIAEVLDFAYARAGIDKANPADWKRIQYILPRQPHHEVRHFAALAYQKLAAFYAKTLPGNDVVTCAAMRFLILTATRTKETLTARWEHIDLSDAVWSIPKTKTFAAHRVALSRQALELLRFQAERRIGPWVFAGRLPDRPLNPGALTTRFRDMGLRGEVTVHGMRSTFADYFLEQHPEIPLHLAEKSLAHKVGSATHRAYARSDQLLQRRDLMAIWGDYVAGRRKTKSTAGGKYRSDLAL